MLNAKTLSEFTTALRLPDSRSLSLVGGEGKGGEERRGRGVCCCITTSHWLRWYWCYQLSCNWQSKSSPFATKCLAFLSTIRSWKVNVQECLPYFTTPFGLPSLIGRAMGLLFKNKISHSVSTCWRTSSTLVPAVIQWFLGTAKSPSSDLHSYYHNEPRRGFDVIIILLLFSICLSVSLLINCAAIG